MQSLAARLPGEVVAIDGKTVRRSHDRWLGVPALHVVSAWAAEAQLLLGLRKTDARSNEITAIPQLLELLEWKGCIVPMDAMGCQTAIAKDLRARGADYVLSLKQNQLHLYEAVAEMFAHARSEAFDGCPHTFTERVGKGHGRIETRRCWTLDDPDYRQHVDSDRSWPGLRSLVMVEAERRLEGRTATEIRYFLSSLPAQDARLPQVVHRHWGIENSLHWVLDIAFREDESRIRSGHAAHNMALLRRLALNLLRRDQQAAGLGRTTATSGNCSLNKMRLPRRRLRVGFGLGIFHCRDPSEPRSEIRFRCIGTAAAIVRSPATVADWHLCVHGRAIPDLPGIPETSGIVAVHLSNACGLTTGPTKPGVTITATRSRSGWSAKRRRAWEPAAACGPHGSAGGSGLLCRRAAVPQPMPPQGRYGFQALRYRVQHQAGLFV